VRYEDRELTAVVQYCIYRDESYFVGVEFKESSRWSPDQFRPQHMLDPRELTKKSTSHREDESQHRPV
jgi:hypothetical protein